MFVKENAKLSDTVVYVQAKPKIILWYRLYTGLKLSNNNILIDLRRFAETKVVKFYIETLIAVYFF